MNLNEFAQEIHRNSVLHGWWPKDRTDAEVLSLVHSEWSEALESYRNNESITWDECTMGKDDPGICEHENCPYYHCGSPTGHWVDGRCEMQKAKPCGVGTELIDGCIRLLDAMAAWGMVLPDDALEHMDDVREVIERQPLPNIVMMLHQRTSELWSNKRGQRPEQTAWDIADMLCIVWIWIKKQGADPDIIMTEKHEYNKTRPYRHGGKKI